MPPVRLSVYAMSKEAQKEEANVKALAEMQTKELAELNEAF